MRHDPAKPEAAAARQSLTQRLNAEAGRVISKDDLQRAFKKFDYDSSGAIDERELQQAMRIFGVPGHVNTARKVMRQIDSNANGVIEWEEFQEFFSRVASPEDIQDVLSVQCHRYFEYKQAVEHDPTFAKTFKLPPTVSHSQKLEGHIQAVERVAWLSDDELLSGSIDGEVRLWSVSRCTGESPPTPQRCLSVAPGCALYSMAVHERSRTLVAALDGRGASGLRLWSVDEGCERMAYEGVEETLYCCALADTRPQVASGAKSGVLALHDVSSPQCLVQSRAHRGVIHSVAVRGGSTALCTASRDGTVKIWDTRTIDAQGRRHQVIEEAACGGAVLEAIWRNEFEILSCGEDYCVKRWDIRQVDSGPVMSYLGHTSAVRALDVSPDGRLLATGTQGPSARVWKVDELGVLEGQLAEELRAERALSAELEAAEARFNDGAGNVETLRELQRHLQERRQRMGTLQESRQTLRRQGSTQATVGCDGPKLSVSAVAWRAAGADGRLTLAVGSQDQGVYLYHLGPEVVL